MSNIIGSVALSKANAIDTRKTVQKNSKMIAVPYSSDRITYAGGTWETGARTTAILGTHKFCDTADATATLNFTGDYIGVVVEAGAYSGNMEIILDGASQGTFDCYYTNYYPFIYFAKKLLYGDHTIVVKVLGTKNASSGGTYIWIDHFIYNVDRYDITNPQKSGVIITFDDTTTSTYDLAITKMEEYGFKGTCFINPGIDLERNIDASNFYAWKIYFLKVHDFEIASHSWEHLDLTSLTEDQVRTSLRKSVEWLQANCMDSGHFAAPLNNTNATVIKVAKEFHCSHSIGGDATFDRYAFDPYAMPRHGIQESTNIATTKALIDYAKANNRVLTIYFHTIKASGATGTQINKEKFDEIIDYIASVGLTGMRMRDFLPY